MRVRVRVEDECKGLKARTEVAKAITIFQSRSIWIVVPEASMMMRAFSTRPEAAEQARTYVCEQGV